MIWGAPEEKSKMDLFFSGNAIWELFVFWRGPLDILLLFWFHFIFSWRRPFEIFFPGKPFQIYFFLVVALIFVPEEGFLRFIFSLGRPFEIYFFLLKAFWDLFFPEEGHPRFFFSISPGIPRHLMVVLLFEILLRTWDKYKCTKLYNVQSYQATSSGGAQFIFIIFILPLIPHWTTWILALPLQMGHFSKIHTFDIFDHLVEKDVIATELLWELCKWGLFFAQ